MGILAIFAIYLLHKYTALGITFPSLIWELGARPSVKQPFICTYILKDRNMQENKSFFFSWDRAHNLQQERISEGSVHKYGHKLHLPTYPYLVFWGFGKVKNNYEWM